MSSSPTDLAGGDGGHDEHPRADAPPDSGLGGLAAGPTADVLMPRMGTSVAEGTLVQWRVAIGEAVRRDQVLCEVSTDKVDVECPAAEDGVLAEILVGPGETVDVGTAIARLRVGTSSAEPAIPGDAPVDLRAARRDELRRSSPVAARLAAEHRLDLRTLVGTGRHGRVTKRDVLAAAGAHGQTAADAPESPAATPMHTESPYRHDPTIPIAGSTTPRRETAGAGSGAAPDARTLPVVGPATPDLSSSATLRPAADVPTDLGGEPVAVSRMRRAIAGAVRRSLDTAAHCTTVVECDMTRVERERRALGITALPLVARATIEALQAFPALNATFDGETIVRHGDRVHLGIAVSLGEDGLIAPVIHDAQDLSVQGLARRIRELAARARAGALSPDEVRGGTFTITNPGAAGALMATPVIDLPQVAILDLEAIVRRPVVLTDADGGEGIAIRPMVHLCMGWDHRALDGLYAARFLTALRGRLES